MVQSQSSDNDTKSNDGNSQQQQQQSQIPQQPQQPQGAGVVQNFYLGQSEAKAVVHDKEDELTKRAEARAQYKSGLQSSIKPVLKGIDYEKLQEIDKKITDDEEFKTAIKEDPESALKEEGFTAPEGLKVKFQAEDEKIEQAKSKVYIRIGQIVIYK